MDIGFKDYRGSLKIMGYQDRSRLLEIAKSLFGKQKTVPYCDRFCYGNSPLPVLKRKGNTHLYGGTERNRCIQGLGFVSLVRFHRVR